MKVIVAGFSKTGTKSMTVALQQLGYGTVYDHFDHFWYHDKDWKKICAGSASIEDFKRMYEDVDAIVAAPIFAMWQEIHEAFPDSKIILTTRDEDSWYKSLENHVNAETTNYFYILLQLLTPTGWKHFQFRQRYIMLLCGVYLKPPYQNSDVGEMLSRRAFRHHQAYCLQNAPKDKLLVYSVKQGWEPLCRFLNKDIPDGTFPHVNVHGELIDRMMTQHPAFLQMRHELKILLYSALSLVALGSCYFFKNRKFRFLNTLL